MPIRYYRIVYLAVPEYPEIERFVRTSRHTTYINTASAPGAKVVKLIQ